MSVSFRKAKICGKLDNGKTKRFLFRKTNLCGICGEAINNMKESSIDHIIPRSKGGSDRLDNLQLAHIQCNNNKGDVCRLSTSSPN